MNCCFCNKKLGESHPLEKKLNIGGEHLLTIDTNRRDYDHIMQCGPGTNYIPKRYKNFFWTIYPVDKNWIKGGWGYGCLECLEILTYLFNFSDMWEICSEVDLNGCKRISIHPLKELQQMMKLYKEKQLYILFYVKNRL